MPPFVGVASAEQFLQLHGTKSGRDGGATAAYKAGVPEAEWQAHGNWSSDARWRYIERDEDNRTPVGKVIMRPAQPGPAPSA